jgi:hypothetical protein
MYKIGYLGAINAHFYSLENALMSRSVTLCPLESSFNEFSAVQVTGSLKKSYAKIKRVTSQLIGTKSKTYQSRLVEYFESGGPKVIIAYWGSNVVGDVIKLKKSNPDAIVLLNVLCHPMGLSSATVKFQNMYMRFASRYIDGYIFSSGVMKKYFSDNNLYNLKTPSVIIPPVLSKQAFPQKRLPECSNTPNIVYLGRPDWWAGQPTDNVTTIINTAVDSGIHVYSPGHIDNEILSEGNRHIFRSMKLEQLSEFATQFDASVIIYNTDACGNTDRFKVTIPDRLIASVAFGIPIAIPNVGYDACKEFLKPYEAVIEFKSFIDLKIQLENRDSVLQLKEKAKKNSQRYTLEGFMDELIVFTKSIVA